MQYRKMPGSDDDISVLGYGCMRLPTKRGGAASSSIEVEAAVKQIRMAIDSGVNYLDTAYPYHRGASESFLGEHVLKDGYREKVFIATKLPCFMIHKAESVQEIFEKQLAKLQVDYIDYYLLHALDILTWERMLSFGIIDFMDSIKASGKVRHMGFSFHGKKEDFMTICDGYDFDFAQIQYNLLDEHFQAGIEGIEYAHKKGMGVIVMEPLRGGSLVGEIPKEVQKVYDQAQIKRSPADWALRYVWNNPAVTLLLSGMNTEEQVIENMQVASESLPNSMSDDDHQIINRVRDTYNDLLQVGCTGCAYCMPCPAGINIPAAFKNLNNAHMFSKRDAWVSQVRYLGVLTDDGKPHFTSACIDCGKCESHCPQNIPIRETFKQVRKELEGPTAKITAAVLRRFFIRGNKRSTKTSTK